MTRTAETAEIKALLRDHEQKAIAAVAGGRTYREAAAELGLEIWQVGNACRKVGLRVGRRRPRTRSALGSHLRRQWREHRHEMLSQTRAARAQRKQQKRAAVAKRRAKREAEADLMMSFYRPARTVAS